MNIISLALKYRLVFFLFVIYLVYIACGIGLYRQAHIINYSDTDDYNILVYEKLHSPNFWAGKRTLTTPLIWKMLYIDGAPDLNGTYSAVPLFYAFLSMLNWGALAAATAFVLRKSWLKITAFVFFLAISLSKMIFFWNWTLLSESLSISFFVLLAAIGIILIYTTQRNALSSTWQQIIIALGISIIIFLWSFTRDANIFIALGFAGLLIIFLLFRWKKIKYKTLAISLIASVMIIVTCQLFTIQLGKRWQYPFINVLGQRILINSEYKKFFTNRGLPSTEKVMRFTGQWANSYGSDWSGFEKWLKTNARATYVKFLLTHPGYTFNEPARNWKELLDGDWSIYGKSTVNNNLQNKLTQLIWPHGLYLKLLTISVILITFVIISIKKVTPYLSLSVAFFLLVIPGVLSVWHGDAMEIVRHSAENGIQLRLALMLMLFFSLDILNFKNIFTRSN